MDKPKPLDIATHPPTDPKAYWPLWLRHGPEHAERLALLMSHAPELLHELKAAAELLVDVCDHYRDGKPMPSALGCRRVAEWNVINLAEGKITEGTHWYPPQDG
jgi:hypothetical protein